MKKFFALLPGLIFTITVFSQSCPPYYHFYSQADIDNFQNIYPDCSEIEGSILIEGLDITNLNGLLQLTSIGGDLLIGTYGGYPHNPLLQSLNGLNNITFIGGDLSIGIDDGYPHNTLLKDLNGLNSLAFIGGILNINSNFCLEILEGLENLASIGGDLTINHNVKLRRLTGLNGLATVGGQLKINRNDSLLTLSGLNNLTSVGGSIQIGAYPYFGNISLTSLTGLEALTSFVGFLEISENYSLTSIAGLGNIGAGSATGMRICNNTALSRCDIEMICTYLAYPTGIVDIYNNAPGCRSGIDASMTCGITSPCLPVGNYNISSQADVDNFQTIYPNCSDLKGHMKIVGEDIINLNGLSQVNSVESYLWIEQCDSLTNLAGLTNLATTDALIIRNNPALVNLAGLEIQDSIAGEIDLTDNSALTSLTGLESLTKINGNFKIYSNYALTSLAGMENLTAIGHNLLLNDDTALTSLGALENLRSTGGNLYIISCSELTSLAGLDSLDPGSIYGLYIHNNEKLSDCEVQSICECIANPNGTIDIHDNATGCNTRAEVEAACEVGLNEILSENQFTLSPNPSSTNITIETITCSSKFQISIFNFQGQEVIQQQIIEGKTIIDVSTLPAGVYFVRMTAESAVSIQKFVKID